MKRFTTGYVRARLRSPGRWLLDWRDPQTGRRVRETVRAETDVQAKQQARAKNDDIVAGRCHLPRRGNEPTVGQALEAAINVSNANLKTRKQYTWNANKFLEWLGTNRPKIKSWLDLNTEAVRAYLTHCDRELALSRPSLHYRLVPIKMASRLQAENEPERYRDFARA